MAAFALRCHGQGADLDDPRSGLVGQSKTARLATMAWYGWDIVGLSYGFAAIPSSRILRCGLSLRIRVVIDAAIPLVSTLRHFFRPIHQWSRTRDISIRSMNTICRESTKQRPATQRFGDISTTKATAWEAASEGIPHATGHVDSCPVARTVRYTLIMLPGSAPALARWHSTPRAVRLPSLLGQTS